MPTTYAQTPAPIAIRMKAGTHGEGRSTSVDHHTAMKLCFSALMIALLLLFCGPGTDTGWCVDAEDLGDLSLGHAASRILRACRIRLSVIFRGRRRDLDPGAGCGEPGRGPSRIRSRSKLASAPKMLKMSLRRPRWWCRLIRNDRKPTPFSSRSVIVCSRCGRFRPNLSSRHTTRVSPSRRWRTGCRVPGAGRRAAGDVGPDPRTSPRR